MAGIFGKELKTLMTTVARKATVTMTLEPGVSLVEVYGYTFEQTGRTVTIRLPDIYGGQQRKIMCKLRIPANHEGKQQVAKVQLTFLDVETNRELASNTSSRVDITSDATRVARGTNKHVMAKAEQVIISKNLKEAMKSYGSGDVSAAQVRLRRQISSTMRANADLKDPFLDRLVGKMKKQLEATEAAPSSARGRSLVKGAKFDAYKLSK